MDLVRTLAERVGRAWRGMAPEQRLAALAALLLLATLFLPWYEKSVYDEEAKEFVPDKLSGFGSADFVMASVVLVALAVLAMMLARGEGRGFHLPGGDGIVIMVAGGWAALLIFYRVLDHPDVSGQGATIGIQWGVFVAFLAAAFLVYAGFRIRIAHRPEPPLPLDRPEPRPRPRTPRPPAAPPPTAEPSPPTVARDPAEAPTRPVRRRRPASAGGDEPPIPGQMSFDEAETQRLRDR
ncbi:MAG TPA: hypothetical protein VFR97_14890 [Capillimicrobium sp.]|nr:hypothetical protein [Capillimicrobium sp.]